MDHFITPQFTKIELWKNALPVYIDLAFICNDVLRVYMPLLLKKLQQKIFGLPQARLQSVLPVYELPGNYNEMKKWENANAFCKM